MHPVARPAVRPLFGIALGLVVVSTASIAIRYAQAYAPSIVIAAWRLAVAGGLGFALLVALATIH